MLCFGYVFFNEDDEEKMCVSLCMNVCLCVDVCACMWIILDSLHLCVFVCVCGRECVCVILCLWHKLYLSVKYVYKFYKFVSTFNLCRGQSPVNQQLNPPPLYIQPSFTIHSSIYLSTYLIIHSVIYRWMKISLKILVACHPTTQPFSSSASIPLSQSTHPSIYQLFYSSIRF